MAKAGNLVSANTTELITITQVAPIYVTFAMPAVHLDEIKRQAAGSTLAVTATPQSTGGQPASGALTFIDNAVDPATDTIKLKATFPNTDRALCLGGNHGGFLQGGDAQADARELPRPPGDDGPGGGSGRRHQERPHSRRSGRISCEPVGSRAALASAIWQPSVIENEALRLREVVRPRS